MNPRISKPSNNKAMLLSKYVICSGKKSRFIKKIRSKWIIIIVIIVNEYFYRIKAL